MTKVINVALSQFGIKEITGKRDNPEVLKYFNALGFDGSKLKDETSWCASFANWVLKECGLPYQKKLNARSFLDLGEPTNSPELGDVVVFWRENRSSWKGHVGFYVRQTKDWIYVLGGNQSNQVKISAYRKYRLLGYRKIR